MSVKTEQKTHPAFAKTYAGIDLGNEGAIAIMRDGKIEEIHPMPLQMLAKKKTVSTSDLVDLFEKCSLDTVVVIEECSAHLQSQRVAASMWFGFRGILEAMETLRYRWVLAPAKVWQKEFAFTSGNALKEQSVATARSLFPDLSLARKVGGRDDHNFSDAVLLAEYGRRRNY